jgi:cytoskeletal protein CcmA (bactofilin family)
MVFNRKAELSPNPAENPPPLLRRVDRPSAVDALQGAAGTPSTQSVIGSDMSIEGQTITIRCKGMLKVLGDIQADVHSKHLEVGREANIQGSIAAETVAVFGRVSGAIQGAHVVLHSSAEVEGDIQSHLLSIEQGAAFDGRSRRVANPADIAPQLERSTPPGVRPAQQFPGFPDTKLNGSFS